MAKTSQSNPVARYFKGVDGPGMRGTGLCGPEEAYRFDGAIIRAAKFIR